MDQADPKANAGGCRCGAARFAVTGDPLITVACHCHGCQKMTAGPFSLSSLYAADAFTLTAGETVRGGAGTGPDHQFCPKCLSWVFTIPDGMDGYVNVRSTLLDDYAGHAPFAEFYLDEGLPRMSSGARHSFGHAPDSAGFRQLIQDFSTQR